jgi:chloride channel protein, CIC family
MQKKPLFIQSKTKTPAAAHSGSLGDFRTDRRVLLLSVLAVPIGAIGALVAKALLWLIAIITNLFSDLSL